MRNAGRLCISAYPHIHPRTVCAAYAGVVRNSWRGDDVEQTTCMQHIYQQTLETTQHTWTQWKSKPILTASSHTMHTYPCRVVDVKGWKSNDAESLIFIRYWGKPISQHINRRMFSEKKSLGNSHEHEKVTSCILQRWQASCALRRRVMSWYQLHTYSSVKLYPLSALPRRPGRKQ